MMIARAVLVVIRLLSALILVGAVAVSLTDTSYAAQLATPNPAVLGKRSSPPQAAPSAAPAASIEKASSGNYLADLLEEINARRAMVGTQPMAYIGDEANAAVDAYLADLTPRLVATFGCYHGSTPAWDYVEAATGFSGEARGEVLACPDETGYWTSDRIADAWLHSPIHFQEIYADRDANAVACGTYGAQHGGRAFETIACVTFRL
jgi:uncharacterized protein YkwD